jgi:hypothetical protein
MEGYIEMCLGIPEVHGIPASTINRLRLTDAYPA